MNKPVSIEELREKLFAMDRDIKEALDVKNAVSNLVNTFSDIISEEDMIDIRKKEKEAAKIVDVMIEKRTLTNILYTTITGEVIIPCWER